MRLNPHRYIYAHKRRSILALSLILLAMIYFFKDASITLRATTTIAFLLFFYLVDHFFDLRFKTKHYIFIVIIAIASIMLSPLYYVYPNYDKVQHFIEPILICSIIFHTISKLHLPLKWKIVFTVFVVLGILGLFEIGEYALDQLFDLKLQGVYLRDTHGFDKLNLLQEKNDDTMIDLIFGSLGSVGYGIIMFISNRKHLSQSYLPRRTL